MWKNLPVPFAPGLARRAFLRLDSVTALPAAAMASSAAEEWQLERQFGAGARRVIGPLAEVIITRPRVVIAPRHLRRAARGRLAGQGDADVLQAFLPPQVEQDARIPRLQPHAAMRGRLADRLEMVGAVNGVALPGEEHRIRHRRVVPFAAEMRAFHAERRVGAGRRVIAARAELSIAIDKSRQQLTV